MTRIIVLGSLNMDLVVRAKRSPEAGETLPAEEFHTIPGGKGANQAAAIARLGVDVALIGRIGKDDFGKQLLSNLLHQGVDVSLVREDPSALTGLALIVVDQTGENRILLISGANGRVAKEDVDEAVDQIAQAKLMVCQLETLHCAVEHAIETSNHFGVPFLLNPAPAFPIPDTLLNKISYLILNETEAEVVSGLPVDGIDGAKQAGRTLCQRGANTVIVTLGAQGAVVASQDEIRHIPGYPIYPVDTTAAGDAFIGGFAASTVQGLPLYDRVRYANACGALAATKLGAQTSLPNRAEVAAFLQQADVSIELAKLKD